MPQRKGGLRIYRYSPLNYPGYYIIVLGAYGLGMIGGTSVAGSSLGHVLGTAAALASLYPRRRTFFRWGEVGAIESSRRLFIRDITPGHGVLKRNLVLHDVVRPSTNGIFLLTEAVLVPDEPAQKPCRLGFFSQDNFSFLAWSWNHGDRIMWPNGMRRG